jgi:hypothetical protein
MMARSPTLQPKAGYIDARPPTANSTKFSCNARPDHTLGQTRSSGNVRFMSASHPIATKSRTSRHFGFGPFLTARRRPSGAYIYTYWPRCHWTAFMPNALPDVRVAGRRLGPALGRQQNGLCPATLRIDRAQPQTPAFPPLPFGRRCRRRHPR